MAETQSGAPEQGGQLSQVTTPTETQTNTQIDTTPQPIKLSPDSLIQVDGTDKPIKYSDHFKGFQSQATKANQKAAQLERQIAEIAARDRERDEELRRYRTALGTDRKTDPNAELINQLKQKSYLNGEEAAWLAEQLLHRQSQGNDALTLRDNAILTLAQRFQALEKQLAPLRQERTQSAFKSKIGEFVKSAGLPDDATEFAQELYLAYEGDDLDEQFPEILNKRWTQLQSLVRKADKARLTAARTPFVPGKGGVGSAAKPLNTAKMSAKEIADSVWDSLSASDT